MSIQLTDSAAERVRQYLDRRPAGIGLRLAVRKTGCSGFAYVVDLTDTVTSDDEVFEQRNVRIVVDRAHLPMLRGTEIDFVQDGLNETFQFRNPNVTAECGCGESFAV